MISTAGIILFTENTRQMNFLKIIIASPECRVISMIVFTTLPITLLLITVPNISMFASSFDLFILLTCWRTDV